MISAANSTKPGARNAYGMAERRRGVRRMAGRTPLPCTAAVAFGRSEVSTGTTSSLGRGQQRVDVLGRLVQRGLNGHLALERRRQVILQRRVDLRLVGDGRTRL